MPDLFLSVSFLLPMFALVARDGFRDLLGAEMAVAFRMQNLAGIHHGWRRRGWGCWHRSRSFHKVPLKRTIRAPRAQGAGNRQGLVTSSQLPESAHVAGAWASAKRLGLEFVQVPEPVGLVEEASEKREVVAGVDDDASGDRIGSEPDDTEQHTDAADEEDRSPGV